MQHLLDQLPVLMWSVDHRRKTTVLQGERLASTESKMPPELNLDQWEFLGGPFSAVRSAMERALNGEIAAFQHTFGTREFEGYAEPWHQEGEPLGLMAVALDVTERRRAENALRESEERQRALSKLSTVGLFRIGSDAYLIYANDRFSELAGGPAGQIRSRAWIDAIHPVDREQFRTELLPALANRQSVDSAFRFRRPDGSVDWVHCRLQPAPPTGSGQALFSGVVTEVTKIKEAEYVLAFRQKVLSRLAHGSDPMQALADLTELLEQASEGARGFVQAEADITGDSPLKWAPNLAPELLDGLHALLEDGTQNPDSTNSPPRPKFISLTPEVRGLSGAMLSEWLGLGGLASIRLTYRNETRHGFMGLVYSSSNRPSSLDLALLETAADLALFALDRSDQEKITLINRDLEAVNQRILEGSRLKSEFLAKMSHELRTPLNAIIGFSQLLLDRKPGAVNAKQADYLSDILQSGMHLLRIINDVLDLAKIESGKMDLYVEEVSVGEIATEVCEMVMPLAQAKGFKLRKKFSLDPEIAYVDAQKFRQILTNLVSNAIKFTPENGDDVRVELIWEDDSLIMAVTDSGIGIHPRDLTRLFQPFQQLRTEANRRQAGSGLGLSICQQMAELHGGDIRVHSEPGKGSRFQVRFPGAIHPAVQEELRSDVTPTP
jgi:PAS domain S-box-containing protein